MTQVVIPSSRQSSAGGGGAAAAAAAAVEHSVPGSVHDSADDESGSELSELDEEPTPPRSLFPGLVARVAKESPSGEVEMEKGEGKEGGDGDEVMDDVHEGREG